MKLEKRSTEHKGLGVFTVERIAAGSKVLELGKRLLPTEALTDDLLALQVGDDLWLCSDGSLLDDRINHSCEPNLGFLTGDLVLYALRDIEQDEELCWDYSTSLSWPGWSLDCRCGSAWCRGVVRPWGELELADRERLRGCALHYLRHR
jgi:SET domain-containing protein